MVLHQKKGQKMDNDPPQSQLIVAVAMVFEGGLGVIAIAVAWLLNFPLIDSIQLSVSAIVWGALAAIPAFAALILCVKCPLGPFVRLVQMVDEMLIPLFKSFSIADIAAVSILAGLGEELLFRGLCQGAVAKAVGGESGNWIGLIVGGILFGLAHPITFTYIIFAAFMGFYMGGLWIASGNLLVPITTHAIYDFVAIVYLAKIRTRQMEVGA